MVGCDRRQLVGGVGADRHDMLDPSDAALEARRHPVEVCPGSGAEVDAFPDRVLAKGVAGAAGQQHDEGDVAVVVAEQFEAGLAVTRSGVEQDDRGVVVQVVVIEGGVHVVSFYVL